MTVPVICDIKKDYLVQIKEDMKKFGVRDIQNISDEKEIMYRYLSLSHRLVPPLKRKCFLSKELHRYLEDRKRHSNSVNRIIKELELGKNMTKYLSKNILKASFSDRMFFHYGVFHFHLGTEKEVKSDFIKRTGEILFGYLDRESNDFYLLGIYEHGQWLDEDILKVLYKNWEDIFLKQVIHVGDAKDGYSKSEREYLRKINATIPLEIEGKTFFTHGIVSANGSNTILIKNCYYYLDLLENISSYIINNFWSSIINVNTSKEIIEDLKQKKMNQLKLKASNIYFTDKEFCSTLDDKEEEIIKIMYSHIYREK